MDFIDTNYFYKIPFYLLILLKIINSIQFHAKCSKLHEIIIYILCLFDILVSCAPFFWVIIETVKLNWIKFDDWLLKKGRERSLILFGKKKLMKGRWVEEIFVESWYLKFKWTGNCCMMKLSLIGMSFCGSYGCIKGRRWLIANILINLH